MEINPFSLPDNEIENTLNIYNLYTIRILTFHLPLISLTRPSNQQKKHFSYFILLQNKIKI